MPNMTDTELEYLGARVRYLAKRLRVETRYVMREQLSDMLEDIATEIEKYRERDDDEGC